MKTNLKSGLMILILTSTISCTAPKQLGLIKIAESTGEYFGPAEPSIAISPVNPDIIVAGSILDRVHYSKDGGHTFNHTALKSPLGVYGDPVVHADHMGRFYYVHLGNPDGQGRRSNRWLESLVIQQSTDAGQTWSEGAAIGTNPPKQQDKPWIASDATNGDLAVTWTEFDKYGSTDKNDRSRIRFSKSTNQGKTWSTPMTISDQEGNCLDDDYTPEGAVPAFGPQHEIYVSWGFDQKLWFDKSSDGGKTWLPQDMVISDQIDGWSLDVPGLGRANGMPVTCTDIGVGKYKGSVYVCWADMKSGAQDMDIWCMYSRDGGAHWSDRIRVNGDESGRFQFLPWMTVDQSSGYLYIVYYDRRHHADHKADIVVAYSKNGGQTFKEILLKESTFSPPSKEVFFGDYNNISAVQGVVRPIWTSYADKKLSVWTAIIQGKGRGKKVKS